MKKKMVFLFAVFMGVSISNHTAASELKTGLGIGIDDASFQVYAPIVLKAVTLEPTISWFENDNSRYGQPGGFEGDFMRYELGLGIFHKRNLTSETVFYYGARAGYVQEETKFVSFSSTSGVSQTTKLDGYFVAPTLGFEYFFVPGVSLGSDIAYQYSRLDGKEKTVNTGGFVTTPFSERVIKQTTSDIRTKAILRFYF